MAQGMGKVEAHGEQDITFIGVCIAKGQHAPCKQRQGLETAAWHSTGTQHRDAQTRANLQTRMWGYSS